jgi:polysaccharide biosynthesis transport protein
MEPNLSPTPFAPINRFHEASRLYARVHRYQVLLRRHWWVPILSLIIVLTPVSIFTAKSPPTFESRAKMWMTAKLNIPEGKLYSEEISSFMGTQAELIRSRTILERALAKIRRQHPEWPLESTNYPVTFPFKFEARESPKSAVVELSAVGSEPESTRAFLAAVMDEFLSFRKETRSQTSYSAQATLADQVESLAKELKDQQDKMHAFQMSNSVVFLQEQGQGAGAYLAKIIRQLSAQQTELRVLQMMTPEQLRQMGSRTGDSSEGPLPGESTAKEMVMSLSGPQADYFKVNQEIAIRKAKRDELSEFLRDNHPKIIKLDQDIAGLKRLVELFKDQSITALETRKQALQVSIKNLESDKEKWEVETLEASRKMAEFERMKQDADRIKVQYERSVGILNTVDMSKNLDQENLGIMEAPSPARSLAGTTKKLLLGLIAGLFVGFGILYLVDLFDDRFASITELRDQLTELVIGQVPDIPNAAGASEFLELVRQNDERHVFVESFRNLRSSLLFMFEEARRPKTILVTSAVPEEGKTTVAANLGVTLARAGARVLLIDADLRRDTLYRYLNLPPKPGFAEVLGQEINYAQTIVPTSTPNFWFMPAGDSKESPGELFLGPSTDVFLREIYPQYDFILMDSAPIMATDDSAGLAHKVDGVLFVVRGSFTSARTAREALGLMHQRQVNVLGLIFNRAIASSSDYYYYYEYTDSYGPSKKRKKASPATSAKPAPASPPGGPDKA